MPETASHNPIAGGSSRKDWLDIARGLSITLVVLYHINLWLADLGHGIPSLIAFDKVFRPIRMPLFFLVSGYILRLTKKDNSVKYVLERSKLFIYLYAVWSLIDWSTAHAFGLTSQRVVFGNSASQLISMWYRPETGLWFIWALTIYNVIIGCTTKIYPRLLVLCASILSTVAMGKYLSFFNFAQVSALYYAPFFLIGLHYGAAIERLIFCNVRAVTATSLLTYLILNALIINLDHSGVVFGIFRFVDCVVGATLGCCVSVQLSKVSTIRRFISYLGRRTIQIYLPHEPMVAILCMCFLIYEPNPNSFKYVAVPAILVLTLFLSIVLAQAANDVGLGTLYKLPLMLSRSKIRISTVHKAK